MPVIFHLDLDSFFVSAERLRNPALVGKRVAVGFAGARGVISSASYEARRFGVRSAMPTAQALRLCPGLVLVRPDHAYYSELSKKVFAQVESFTPVHEQVSVDEAYLEMSGSASLYGPPREAARLLRARIREATGLTASIGIASNRMVAKVASDYCKPDNLHEVPPGEEAAFLAPLPVRVLPGCGPATQEWLAAQNVFTVGDLQKYPRSLFVRKHGSFGEYLHDAAWGKGSTEFHREAKTRSISRESTFERNEGNSDRLRKVLWEMCCEMGRELREEGAHARAIRLKLRYPPFETVHRSRVLDVPAQRDDALFEAATRLFDENWTGAPLRLVGVGCVLGEGSYQPSLFDDVAGDERKRKIDGLKDELRSRFGEGAIKTGRDF